MFKSLFAIGAAASLVLAGCANASDPIAFASDAEREGYGIGALIGHQVKPDVVDLDRKAFLAGLRDALADESRLNQEEIASVIEARRVRDRAAAEERALELAARNEAVGEAFRQEFAKDTGVETLPSGLQYKVLAPGDGAIASKTDNVTLHYSAKFVDGAEFDSSYGAEPVQIDVSRVIPGWSEALQLMPAGSKWQVVVPPDLAYGVNGSGDIIEPGTTLVFEIELVAVG